jgi:maltose alpha-D-glucosyltransferase/alpha-amylase
MHVVLAQPTDNEAFAPRIANAEDCAAWAATVGEQLHEALRVLDADRTWNEEEQALQQFILGHREALVALPPKLAQLGEGTPLTRIHGDLHLGQALVSHGDAYFIDFEGEPARSLAQRRAKSSPLRDVAGMLRSFDYAASSASAAGGAGQSDTAVLRKRGIIERFRQVSEREFLASYQQAIAARPEAVVGPEAASALLNLFLLENVAYEVAYEAANRPTWLGTPLRGLAALIRRLIEPAKS